MMLFTYLPVQSRGDLGGMAAAPECRKSNCRTPEGKPYSNECCCMNSPDRIAECPCRAARLQMVAEDDIAYRPLVGT
eukprot:13791329-Alexandrium_andersonii.AAC.1